MCLYACCMGSASVNPLCKRLPQTTPTPFTALCAPLPALLALPCVITPGGTQTLKALRGVSGQPTPKHHTHSQVEEKDKTDACAYTHPTHSDNTEFRDVSVKLQSNTSTRLSQIPKAALLPTHNWCARSNQERQTHWHGMLCETPCI
jgi:hypothetical protein